MNGFLQIIISALVIILSPSLMFASSGAEIIKLQNVMGDITFYHKRHQERLNDCTICHRDKPGKIKGLGIDWGHNICKECHFKIKNGLIECIDCHQVRDRFISTH